MRKMLNVLYVTTPEAFLAKEGENLIVKVQEKVIFRAPIHYLEGIVTFGYMGASPALLGMCAEKGVSVTFLNEHGKFLASVAGPVKGNVLLRRKQYRMADSVKDSSKIASRFIMGKIANSKTVLRRFISDHGNKHGVENIENICREMARSIINLNKVTSLEEIRGIEGNIAKHYFSSFNQMILHQKEHFFMNERNRRPPLDNLNSLLSFLYTLLVNETRSALETVGLDPYVGFLHRDRPGRPGLALDLMEELRAYLADRLALSLINRKQITEMDFTRKESGAVIIKEKGRKTILEAWQKRKREEITHPFLNEKIPIGLLPYAQALLLSRYLRGDLDDYPPFIWK
ncbi:CRISPR-associated protein, Cas1 family [Carboxydocella sporoproducens DSM 16521]|uniref:CRISPR-associated endonuclease Cas1 n=2 Tax=Carboxydocella TaxID=178898 RepID=A0A1T4SID9_9FIRM|nr:MULTISPECIES: type I-C CRISPR-associated endonuclease Cas1c [Carboxydocella]AVX19279.1 CRISPR-associated protein, Cas1 family [Carboxydocella thermautotrophica]SKA27957.1 CRISPR-associated protein, Cas1 family [Carboxydocella sporoproducens DSM 16521]